MRPKSDGRGRWRAWLSELRPHSIFIGVATVALVAEFAAVVALGQVEGSQGTDITIPNGPSPVTITGASALGADSAFAGLTITVNQTAQLSNQTISVSWTGGTPTDSNQGTNGAFNGFNDNYLQIFQCWGPDTGDNPNDPGPAPTGCEFGANMNNPSEIGLSHANSGPISRALVPGDSSKYAYVDPNGAGTFIPFQPVDGTAAIDVPTNTSSTDSSGEPTWDNPYFDFTTSNEVDYARTYADGTGSALFTVDTGLEAPGLGCGQSVQQPDGSSITPQCWLVIVPRSGPKQENPGGTGEYVDTSPLSGEAWANRISIPLSFNPVGSSCPIGANEERIVGSELAQPAILNWEPSLCSSSSSPPYQYSALSDDQARQEIVGSGSGTPGMAVVSDPIDPTTLASGQSVVYAPLTLSGVVIGFNIERQSSLTPPDAAEEALIGTNVQNIYLTPRLVAKLLTESYASQLYLLNRSTAPASYSWVDKNPENLLDDPDFLQYNPEFKLLNCASAPVDCGGLIVEQPDSDAASVLWKWVLSDPAAEAWLSGQPDPWGMKVNPYYSTDASINPSSEAFGTPTPANFPKSDPYTYQDPTQLPSSNDELPRALTEQDFLPYATSMQNAALETRQANDGSKLVPDYGADSPDTVWTAAGPQPLGEQFVLSITDSADAAAYGLQDASLSRAGDDGASPTFIAPTTASLDAGEAAMQPSSTSSSVLTTDVSPSSSDAYPLTMLSYGAVIPQALPSSQECQDYSSFITYGANQGQTQGYAPGNLPQGYAPLPASLVSQDASAVSQIKSECGANPSPPSTTTTVTTASGSTTTSTATTSQTTPSVAAATPTTSQAPETTPSAATATTVPSTTTTTAARSFSSTSSTTVRFEMANAGGSANASPGRTGGATLEASRWLLPLLLLIGLTAGLLARWTSVLARRIRQEGTS